MSNAHLSRSPMFLRAGRHAAKGLWMYEEPSGLIVISSSRPAFRRGLIPWWKIRAALTRKDRKR